MYFDERKVKTLFFILLELCYILIEKDFVKYRVIKLYLFLRREF